MCEYCTEVRTEIKADLVGLLMNDESNRLVQTLNKHVTEAMQQINERIDNALESGQVTGPRPDSDEIEAAVRDCLMAAVIATGAASIAQATPGYTDEGKQPRSVILGMWAGSILGAEMEDELAEQQQALRHLFGMGDN